MLKINIFQNLTQYLVYFKKYINFCKYKKQSLFYSKLPLNKGKSFFTIFIYIIPGQYAL